MSSKPLIVLCTWPDGEGAQAAARELVRERLAACVSVGTPVMSTYRWQDQIETSLEHPLMIKTTASSYPALEAAISARHPYDVPEIIALSVSGGAESYLNWVTQCTESC